MGKVLRRAGIFALLLTVNSQISSVFAQGSLTPPGPPAPTMKTLTQIEPRTPISSLPYTITNAGSYYLTTNLTGVGGGVHGITILSGNVTIDLNGFTLQGVPASGNGIHVGATITNLVVRNGALTGWGNNGLDSYSFGYPRNMLFEKLTLSANGGRGIYSEAGSIIRDCIAIGNSTDGFYSQGGEITGCLARNNGNAGFNMNFGSLLHCSAEFNSTYGIDLNYSRALDCDCVYNTGGGITCFGTGDEVRRCRIANNGSGLYFNSSNSGNVIENCLIANNSGYGIYTASSSGGDATITGNTFSLNSGGAIVIGESNDYIENNHVVTTSGNYGIAITSAGYTNIVVVKNVVVGGGASYNYSNIGGVNDFGPVGAAASATSPWANISH